MANLSDYTTYIGNPELPDSISTAPLWKHQEAMLKWCSTLSSSLLYSGMSTGKTAVALRYMEQFNGLRLVISPAKPMPVYHEDINKFYDILPYNLFILDNTYGNAKERYKFLHSLELTNSVVVLSYEIAAKLPLHKLSISAVICDEGHRLGSWSGKQSRVLAQSCKDVPHKLVMTGTTFEDGYERIYGVCRWLDPVIPERGYPQARLFGHYNDFLDRFCIVREKNHIKYITGYKNLGELANLIKPFTLHMRTEDVIDLPDLVIRSYPVELSSETRKAYDDLHDDAIIEIPDSEDAVIAPHILARMTRLQQIVASGKLETEEKNILYFDIQDRLDTLEMLLDEIGNEPVVIFTRFKYDIRLIEKLVKRANKSYSILDGSINQVDNWLKGATQVLVVNIAAGSEGLRLERAHHAIIWSLGYSLKQFRQAIARLRRHGQKSKTVFVHTLVADGTIDQDIYDALSRKLDDVLMMDRELDG